MPCDEETEVRNVMSRKKRSNGRQLWFVDLLFAHVQSDERFAQQETRKELALDLGQVVFVQGLLASLYAVQGVGQDQGHQVSLQLIPDHVQVGQICRAHFVAGGGGNRSVNTGKVSL